MPEEVEKGAKPKPEESEVGSLGLALAIVYAIGLTTTNLFLGAFGFTDLSLLKPKAIFTGAVVLGSLVLLASGPIYFSGVVLDGPKRRKKFGEEGYDKAYDLGLRWTRLRLGLMILLPMIFLTLLCWKAANMDYSSPEALLSEWRVKQPIFQSLMLAIGLYGSSILACALAIHSIRAYRIIVPAKSFPGIAVRKLGKLTLYLAGMLLGLSFYMYLFASNLYMAIPPSLGGGAPERMEFIVQDGSMPILRSLGIEMDEEATAGLTTKQLNVLYESESYVGVLLRKTQHTYLPDQSEILTYSLVAVRIDKALLKGVVIDK